MIIKLEQYNNNNFWNEKPPWCQPWSIILTGISIIVTSFFTLHLYWVTGLLTVVILIWWLLFLFIAPAAYAKQPNIFNKLD